MTDVDARPQQASSQDTGEYAYQAGFGNEFASEAVAGALPAGRNSRQRAPLGLFAGTYLAEYGKHDRLTSVIRFINDILLSAPSIIIGLFIYGAVVVPMRGFSAIAGALALAVIVIPVGERLLHENGNPIPPVTAFTWLQVVVGTAALLAVSAVLGLAVGTVLRRSAGAVTAVIAGIVLPYLLATVPGILPVGAEQWLLRVTPAAGFAVQGTLTQYPQVNTVYTPGTGYFPLSPWAGFAVLCAWAAAALALALFLLRRRDA